MTSRIPLAVAFLATSIACGSSPSQATLALSARSAAAPGGSATGALDLPNGVAITEVKVVVRKLKLEGSPAAEDGGTTMPTSTPTRTEGGHDGKAGMERESDGPDEPVLGPCLVDLSGAGLSGGLDPVCAAQVPEGTFRELKFVVGPSSAITDPDLGAGNSLVIKGTVTDASGTGDFAFAAGLVAEVDIEGTFVVSGGKVNNVTVSVDPTGWFGPAGSFLDPRVAANHDAILRNIEASIAAFEDDDRNGHDDAGHDGDAGHR